MQKTLVISGLLLISVFMISCNTTNNSGQSETVTEVMTAESQAQLTPDAVISEFKAGNQRFLNNNLTAWDFKSQVRKTTNGQFPKAAILSCVDSRVPVEYVFDQGIGDIFVARVAGSFMDEDMLGSAEFACKVSGSKILMVMGHENCGAVKAAIDDLESLSITLFLI